MVEHGSKRKLPLLAMLVLACLLLPVASSAPLSRSLSLMKNNQPSVPGFEVPAQGAVVVAVKADRDEATINRGGEAAARMDIEVNDYPGSGANNRHEPRGPGRV